MGFGRRRSCDIARTYGLFMGCTAIQAQPGGLELLVNRVSACGAGSLGRNWQAWFSAALEQLEMDDSFDAHEADGMADALAEAEEALAEGRACEEALHRLVSLFTLADTRAGWTAKARGLSPDELAGTTWDDLHKALDAVASAPSVVARWIDHAQAEIAALWRHYQGSDVLSSEVTVESILGHQFLGQGVAHWLAALAELRQALSKGLDRAAVLAKAEAGQRLLVALQAVEEERASARQNFIAAWMN
jgi:hypothetical protein